MSPLTDVSGVCTGAVSSRAVSTAVRTLFTTAPIVSSRSDAGVECSGSLYQGVCYKAKLGKCVHRQC